MKNCILCGESLSKGKTNREHYVFATLIRNFDKVGIPSRFTHALRIDTCEEGIDAVLAPKHMHNEWATIVVHEKCNQDASGACRDLKYIIDHLDQSIPKDKKQSVIDYYAHLWRVKSSDVIFTISDDPQLDRADAAEIYAPGLLWVGRITVRARDKSAVYCPSVEWYSIWLGKKDALEKIIKE